jgi:hypothetical protein
MNRSIRNIAAASVFVILTVLTRGTASATDLKTLGRLKIPAGASVMTVCADPVVQSVLNEDLRSHPHSGPPTIVTITVNARALAPGVSMQDLSPGDPSVAEMLKEMGAEPPALGDTGDKPLEDPYTTQARRQMLLHEDATMGQLQGYINRREDPGQSPYANLPQDQMYQTAIVARATASDSATEFKVVALVDPGGDVRAAKKLVAEAIADAILH